MPFLPLLTSLASVPGVAGVPALAGVLPFLSSLEASQLLLGFLQWSFSSRGIQLLLPLLAFLLLLVFLSLLLFPLFLTFLPLVIPRAGVHCVAD
jgi:hypothetical protein